MQLRMEGVQTQVDQDYEANVEYDLHSGFYCIK